jgi:hypothetical protein
MNTSDQPPYLKVVAASPRTDADTPAPFFLILVDYDRQVFSVEGPMTNDRPWQDAAMHARSHARRIACGPTGPNRDTLAIDYQLGAKLGGVPPGSIMRVRP